MSIALVEDCIDQLLDVERGIRAEKFRADDPAVGDSGLTGVWCDITGIADLARATGIVLPPLLFVGQAGATKWPSGTRSAATIASRVYGQHLHGNVGSSTLRKTLAGLLKAFLDLEVTGQHLAPASEAALSEWMVTNLVVTVVVWPDRDSLVELKRQVVARLDPPLNLDLDDATASKVRTQIQVLRATAFRH